MRASITLGILLATSTARAEPRLMLEAGGNVRQFPGVGAVAARSATAEANVDTVVALDARMMVGVVGGFYAGLDSEIGKVPMEADAEMIETAGVLGYRFAVRGGALATELAGGVRTFLHDPPTTEPRPGGDMRGVTELRVRGELRVAPWLATGAMVGTSLIDPGDWVAGLFVALRDDRR